MIEAKRIRGGLLPMSALLRPRERTALRAMTGVLGLLVAGTAAQAVSGFDASAGANFAGKWLTPAVYVLVGVIVCWRAIYSTDGRGPWIVFAIGISLYGIGNLVWSMLYEELANPPIPSFCDALWLALYPCCWFGLAGLAQLKERPVPARLWLDALIAGLGVTAIGATVVLHPVLSSLSGGTAAVLTELAYPVCDLLLAAVVVGILALRGWRVDRMWAMLGAGFLALAVADCLYAVQVANGAGAPSSLTNLAYELGVVMLALASWQPSHRVRARATPGPAVLAMPAAFTLSAVALLLYDHFHRLDLPALALAVCTIVVAFARTGIAFKDVQALAASRHEALTDDLTSLPNRRHFLARLRREIASAERTGTEVALMMIDLDHFKELNDTLGHDAGDRLLREIGIRLRGSLRSSDLAARLGGDEFGVLLCSPGSIADVKRIVAKILSVIGDPILLDDLSIRITASLGVALYPRHAGNDQQLMQHADVAMYEAKAAQAGHAFYAPERDTHSPARLILASELSHALQHGGIVAHYQPKATVADGRIVGVEALARWQHPVRGLIGPGEFVAVAEQAGLGRALTRRMLELALDQLVLWRAEGLTLNVAVNTTVADLQDSRFPAEVAAMLAIRGLPPATLILEVTENVVLADPVRVGDVLAKVGELGVGLALDDFGTGFSSLSHLKVLPVGEVKIDRSFVARMTSDRVDAAIVNATIQLAHGIGIRVVAEGVEDQRTWEQLRVAGCELVQGQTICMPRPASELDDLLGIQPHRLTQAASRGAPG